MNEVKLKTYKLQFVNATLAMFVASTIALNTMKSTSDVMYNGAEFLGLGLALFMYRYIEREGFRELLMRNWRITVPVAILFDMGLIGVSWYTLEWRFFVLAVVMANIQEAASMIRSAAINNLMHSQELTEYDIRCTRYFRAGQLFGLVGILTFTQLMDTQLAVEVGLIIHGVRSLVVAYEDTLWLRKYECTSQR